MSQEFRLTRIEQELAEIKRLLLILITKDKDMANALDNLTAKVTAENTVIDSAITLITGLADQIKAANTANDPALNALADSIQAKSDALAAAVTANTAAAPATPPAPAPAT